MDLSDIKNKEEFSAIIINELKSYGVKYHKEKKKKSAQKKPFRKNIFCVHLHLLDLTEVILASGRVVQIPKFVAEACNRILEQVETEGLFRKAGSFIRQKEIRVSLEAGVSLGKLHHVIDVANVIKYFFRELPDPLIPPFIQETLVQCLIVGESYVKAVLLVCLLLPSLTLNTLTFFMQFLYTVSLSQNHNKMSIQNLAIIFTPSLMPFPNVNSQRFTNNVKVVRILIENAFSIGTIPKSIEHKLQKVSKKCVSEADIPIRYIQSNAVIENRRKSESAKKKKKRRSDMFQGLKKIVESALGSTEFLEDTSDGNKTNSLYQRLDENKDFKLVKITETSYIKKNKKEMIPYSAASFSAKKKEIRQSRLSLGGERHSKNSSSSDVASRERRWSIVGSGWLKSKNKLPNTKYEHINAETIENEDIDGGKLNLNINFEYNCNNKLSENACIIQKTMGTTNDNNCCIPHNAEFDAIKDRVESFGCNKSTEFDAIRYSVSKDVPFSADINHAEHVQAHYERTVAETEALLSPATEQLAKSLSRGLNIRRSVDQRAIRSPSARKIGTIRRRSQDSVRNSYIYSVNIGTSNKKLLPHKHINPQKQFEPKLNYKKNSRETPHLNSSYSKNESLSPCTQHNFRNSIDNILGNEYINEKWMSGENFFRNNQKKEAMCDSKNSFYEYHADNFATPVSKKITTGIEETPMLPPRSLPRKILNTRTPINIAKKPSTTSKVSYINRIVSSTPVIDQFSGRASIAQLRSENAGMVLARAKLFDGLGSNNNGRHFIKAEQNGSYAELHDKTNKCAFSKSKPTSFVNSVSKKPFSAKENDFVIEESKSVKNTPTAKRKQNSNSSPRSKQRHHGNFSKLSQKQLMKSIITDDKFIKMKSYERPSTWDNSMKTGAKIEPIKIFRNTKSPRKVKKQKNFQ